jgi:hypothetical protein
MVLVVLLEIADFLLRIWKAFLRRIESEQPVVAPDQAPAPRRRAF